MSFQNGKLQQVDLTVVQESYKQTATPAAYDGLPKMMIPSEHDGVKSVKYKVANLATSLVRVDLPDWRPGMAPPAARDLEYSEIVISAKGVHSIPTTVAVNARREHKIRELNASGPLHMDQVRRAFERRLNTHLKNSTTYNSKAFAGAGTLAAFGNDNVPYKDIEDEIRGNKLRIYSGFTGLGLEAIIDEDLLRVLAGYEEYNHMLTSGNATGRLPKAIDLDEMAEIFARKHGLAAVHRVTSIYDSAEAGQTSSPVRIFGGLLWIGVVDRRFGNSMELDGGSGDQQGMAGGLAVVEAVTPELRTWTEPGPAVEYTGAWGQLDFTSPSYEAESIKMGSFFTNTL